jgi:diguanylate cyclase (GGDEF)-like protein/PAS domain S-box-containing protein
MNQAARMATGLAPDEPVTHRNFSEFNPPATMQLFATTILPAMRTSGFWLGETTVYGAGGKEVPVSYMAIAHRGADGRVDRYSAVMRDITAEREGRQQLLRQTATLRSVTEAIPAIVAVVGSDGRYRFINSSFERWYGAKRDGVIGRTMAEVLGRTEYERSRPWLQRVISGETVSFEKQYAGHGAVKHLAISYIPLWLETGAVDGFVGVAQDITRHRQEENRLLQLSQRDPLTGLLNRAGFEEYLERQIRSGGASALALLYIDLDHFKPVNDKYGHPAGDAVLQMFGERVRALVRPSDAVARLGGDEFAVVLAGVREEANADAVADKIVAAARAPFQHGALELSIGASVGVAFGADPKLGWRELLARADALVYRAKAEGRGRRAT